MEIERESVEQVMVTEGNRTVTVTPWMHGGGVDVAIETPEGRQLLSVGDVTLGLLCAALVSAPTMAEVVRDAVNRSLRN